MAESLRLDLADAGATEAFGERLATALCMSGTSGLNVYLEGDLGAGKTTLVRGFLRRLGHTGRVPSPTYTLVEPYALAGWRVAHIDLYRIRDPRELDDLGLRDALGPAIVTLVEWPDHGAGHLPPADMHIGLQVSDSGRRLCCQALSATGGTVVNLLVAAPGLQEPAAP